VQIPTKKTAKNKMKKREGIPQVELEERKTFESMAEHRSSRNGRES